MKNTFLGVCLLASIGAHAQENSTITNTLFSPPFKFSGYVETYYSVSFSESFKDRKSQGASYRKNDEPAVSLAFFKTSYDTKSIKANFALALGTYMSANYSAEPGLLENLYDANIAIKLSKENNLWLEAGVFSSHIGLEGIEAKDNWSLTRSLTAETTPYFESGAKISHTSNDGKWFLSALILTGWLTIEPVDGNTLPSFGTQVTYNPSSKITLNSSTFIGTDTPDRIRLMRYFHNFYGIFKLNNKLAATLGFDIGMQQKNKGSSAMDIWFSPTAILRYTPTAKTAIAVRVEYYDDPDNVIAVTSPNGFSVWGFSANFDWRLTKNFLWRAEARTFVSKDDIFIKHDGVATDNNTSLTTSLVISF